MKCLQLSSILIILSVTQVRGSSSSEEADNQCAKEFDKQKDALANCTKEQVDEFAFADEAKLIITNYTGDDEAVRKFAMKYCPKLQNAIPCIRLQYDVPDNCQEMLGPFKYNKTVLYSQVWLNILNYVCENNAEVLVQIVQNDGSVTMTYNEKFIQCTREVNQFEMLKENAVEFEINPEFCSAQKNVLDCYLETVKFTSCSSL